MRRHPIIVIILGAALSVFVGYYVHLKLASAPPPLPATTSSGNYSPEQFHHALSNAEKKRVLDGEFRVVRATEEMPLVHFSAVTR